MGSMATIATGTTSAFSTVAMGATTGAGGAHAIAGGSAHTTDRRAPLAGSQRGTSAAFALEWKSAMGTDVQLFLRSLRNQCQRLLTVSPLAAPALNLRGPQTAFLSGITLGFILIIATTTIAAEAQTNRMVVEYVPPTNPAHRALYQRLMERRTLEKLQELFSPFRLPVELRLRTVGCDGVSNAWYQKPAPGSSSPPTVSVCYEYLAEIEQSLPPGTTPAGNTPMDAMVGQFFYVFAHEMGHAMFDVLGIPVFGREEDAADDFATYIMLRFGDQEARALITGEPTPIESMSRGHK